MFYLTRQLYTAQIIQGTIISVINGIVPSLLLISASYQVDSHYALTEGAILALATSLLFPPAPLGTFNTNVDRATILNVFLNAMPLHADKTEAQEEVSPTNLMVDLAIDLYFLLRPILAKN